MLSKITCIKETQSIPKIRNRFKRSVTSKTTTICYTYNKWDIIKNVYNIY